MLNKLEFNNLVITNKKIIQQARAQAIAKVVQKLRKFKDALEKQPDSEVHKKRLRKNVEYIAQLKSLKVVDIMRSLLLKDAKQLNAVLTNGRATPEEVAIAMLGLNKLMQGLVDKFQKSLSLSTDANAKWREEILQTSKRRLKLERTEEKRRKRKELKELKAQSRKRQEWLEKNKPEASVDTEADSNAKLIATVAGNVEVENVTEITETSTDKKKEKLSKARPKEVKQKVPKSVENKRKTREKPIKAVEKTDEITETLPKAQKTKHSEQVKHPNAEAPSKKRKKEEKERPTHVVDPFFITESGQPYLSTAVVLSDDNETDAEDDDEQMSRNEYTKHKPLNKWQENNAARDNNRHPSWLAKEKLKPIITGFKGKKTTFADDGNTTQTIPAVLPPAAPAVESAETGMHPSWIAKQKLKPKIATFTGTKIKFDD